MPNALINETSPYLLQHAHNPVNWYPWGLEALQTAITSDKPILVSIGYAACHWCHVMERESFEDDATAAIMNEHFINIKIDREERPDLDHIYMDAVQAMGGSGGWPLNVFLTPQRKPFYGGTYFPPKSMMGRTSWKDTLLAVAAAFKDNRKEIMQQAKELTKHIARSNDFGMNTEKVGDFSIALIEEACNNILQQADTQLGGFGKAPKFPQTFSILFLLRYSILEKSRNTAKADRALAQAMLSLDKMIDGGIYDQIGGGFARYSTDAEWLAPHFEKMLYDNALLVSVLSEAFQITKKVKYKNAIEDTLAFVERELTHPENGFYAALDADSEGEEGKFYVWSFDEIKNVLGSEAELFCEYYNVSAKGNWEGKNILRVLEPLSVFAGNRQYEVSELELQLKKCREKLLMTRDKRIRPALDDKIILGWNALMNTAYSKAFAATGNDAYKKMAIANMNFLIEVFIDADNNFTHVWKNNRSKYPAFLDDLAYLIQALIQLHTITGNTYWLLKAKDICERVEKDFTEDGGYFYYTPNYQQDVIVRKKEVYDGATPSGNAVMAQNLLELGILFDNKNLIERAEKMIKGLSVVITKYPTSFGVWLSVLYQLIKGTKEIVLLGNYDDALPKLLQNPLPHCIIMASKKATDDFPLLKGREASQALTIYLCEDYACKQPVYSVEELINNLG